MQRTTHMRLDEIVLRAAELRANNHPGAALLPWGKLTDAQKLPWLVKAWQESHP
ncbi:hypothetical protein I5I01_gp85 [Mycobacterium phage MooMoo]|uniref:Uncharacterized protein n=1 Tax=Mycobacterium phage MooMoo TaxID=2108127 RepID=A0A2P1JRD1_9CAUD|nr:hypothetical protein I5I01_gp85 [Mycobacterium phage MooMoo]AVO21690.1 hypothetical protein SEA_MOOMOO_85 [Mycobacterium phage MooMoo]